MRIGIVAGEASGDSLGAGLLKSLRHKCQDLTVEGIAGAQMQNQGAKSLLPAAEISIIGLDGLISNLARLLKIRSDLYHHFIENPPDLFLGIDLPDFNLPLEKRLRKKGIRTVHYVSPTIWAWRSWRIRLIRQAVDHMLVLFPFEEKYLNDRNVPVTFVGHPAADDLPSDSISSIRTRLGVPVSGTAIALLPGSRSKEVMNLGPHFIKAASILQKKRPDLIFMVPYVNAQIRTIFRDQLGNSSVRMSLYEFDNQAKEVMAASDVVLVASGTAALEAAMLRKPMVVAYKVSNLSYLVAKSLASTDFVSMPNNLLGTFAVPELLQGSVSGERIANEINVLLDDSPQKAKMIMNLERIYSELQNDANQCAAETIVRLQNAWARDQ